LQQIVVIECMLFLIQMPVHPTAAKSEVLR
jgi:hypothetical protein